MNKFVFFLKKKTSRIIYKRERKFELFVSRSKLCLSNDPCIGFRKLDLTVDCHDIPYDIVMLLTPPFENEDYPHKQIESF